MRGVRPPRAAEAERWREAGRRRSERVAQLAEALPGVGVGGVDGVNATARDADGKGVVAKVWWRRADQ